MVRLSISSRALFVLIFLAASTQEKTFGQTHFVDCFRLTGSNATVLIPTSASLLLNGSPLSKGSELALFTEDGLCAGVVVWEEKSTGFAVWGDDSQTGDRDGFAAGEALTFRVWNAATAREYDSRKTDTEVAFGDSQPFFTQESVYIEDAVYELRSLTISGDPTSSEEESVPSEFTLHPNYPNPFNPSTTIRYELPQPAFVQITIYNAAGAQVDRLFAGTMLPGAHEVRWNAEGLPTGTYFFRIQADNQTKTQQLVLLR